MGLKERLNKIKNYFTEEEVEEIKVEEKTVSIPAPEVKEEKISPVIEESKTGPIYFDDKDFEDLPISMPKQKEVYREPIKEEKKAFFKPSPIISPVYGVLDKNYYKEDITNKNEESKYDDNISLTVDDVRKKAYGTLEDDLVNNLVERNNEQDVKSNDIFEELVEDKEQEELPDLTIEHTKVEINTDDKQIEKLLDETLNEDDLFDLVDSMYDRKEEE